MTPRITFDPEKFNLSFARLKKGGETFEIVVEPDAVIVFKEKAGTSDIKDVVKAEKIYSNVQHGMLAPTGKFKEIFGTENVLEIAKIIILNGEIQLTAEHRKKHVDEKRKKIINIIQRNGIDPRMNVPHSASRIEDAMVIAKIKIDEFKPAEDQVKDIVRKLQPVIPIRFEYKKIEVATQEKYSHALFGFLKRNYTILSQHWAPDQSFTGIIEIPGGLESEFYDAINKLTHGTVHAQVIEEKISSVVFEKEDNTKKQ
jgi:ribosome maturation protein SDO1